MKEKKKTVVIALDYDGTSQFVAEAGYLLGKRMGAEIVLLHVVTTPVVYTTGYLTYMEMGPIQLNHHDGPKKAAQLFLNKSKEHLGDVTIKTLVKEGEFAETILNAATSLKADVIVMGSHSQRWLENLLLGSVTENVLKNSNIPLYIVPVKKHA
jgi:nucleotide-binding universal stress UspA family protein